MIIDFNLVRQKHCSWWNEEPNSLLQYSLKCKVLLCFSCVTGENYKYAFVLLSLSLEKERKRPRQGRDLQESYVFAGSIVKISQLTSSGSSGICLWGMAW